MTKITLRTSDFMDYVKIVTTSGSTLNAAPLRSLEDKLKLVPNGNYKMPVNVYVPVGTRLSSEQIFMMPEYQRAASQAYDTLRKGFKIIRDDAPSGLQKLLPGEDALSQVRQLLTNQLTGNYPALGHLQESVIVLPKSSGKQVDFFVEYKTQLQTRDQEILINLRIMAQRIYAEILYHRGIQPERPVVTVLPISKMSYGTIPTPPPHHNN